MYRLRDERGLYSDSSAVGLMRLALIELGTRLFERGRIGFKYDTLDLRGAEIDADPRRLARTDGRGARGPGGVSEGQEQDRRPAPPRAAASASAARRRPPASPCSGDERARLRDRRRQRRGTRARG